jgi:hypothetical protein
MSNAPPCYAHIAGGFFHYKKTTKMQEMQEKTLTVTEFAAMHNVTRSAVLSQIKSGAITAHKARFGGYTSYVIDMCAENTQRYNPRGYAGVSRPNSEKSTHNADGTMTCYGFALLAGCAEVTVQHHAKSGKLFAFKRGGVLNATWHIPKEHPQNEAYVKKQKNKKTKKQLTINN